MTIGLVATLKVKDGSQAEFEAVFGELQAAVRANEPDCFLYDLFQDNQDPTVYVVMEQYASQEALQAHGQMPHMRQIGPRMGQHLDGSPSLQFLTRIS
ncbi:MAG: putative quinol monooxygenase [Alphaproteobacteria bacterium]